MKPCVVTMKSNPSSSKWLSQYSLWNDSDILMSRKHKVAHILGVIAILIHIQHVVSYPRTESPYENGTPNYQLVENSFSIEDQIPRYEGDEEWDIMLGNNPSRKNYYDIRNSDEIEFRPNDQFGEDQLGPISTEPSNITTPPVPTGCHEPGCPLPLMSDGAFSLVTMIYVSISFLFVFFAFCWNNHYPRGDSKGAKGLKGKPSCPLITADSKLDSNTTAETHKKPIVNMFDYQKEKCER